MTRTDQRNLPCSLPAQYHVPGQQDSSLKERGDGDGPPDARHPDTRTQKERQRDTQCVKHHADDGGRGGPAQPVENALGGDLQHHEELREAKDQQVITPGDVCLSLRNKH